MNTVKLLLLSQSIAALLCLLLLIWNESEVSCDTITLRLFETICAIVAWWTMREQTKISWHHE